MQLFNLSAALIATTGLCAVINHFALGLPSTIGIVVIALLASLLLMSAQAAIPSLDLADEARSIIGSIDFSETVLHGLLGIILFAGALNTDLGRLRRERWAIALAATVGVVVSAAIVGLAYAPLAGVAVAVGLTFGVLIAPTDPVAVLSLLRETDVPEILESRIAGESLFNDGIGYTLFLAVTSWSLASADPEGPVEIAFLFITDRRRL